MSASSPSTTEKSAWQDDEERRDGVLSGDDSSPDATSHAIVKDWTDAEEKKLLFRLDCILMPLLTFAFFNMQLDRTNLYVLPASQTDISGNAITQGFLGDIGITQAQYNVGQQLVYVGIVVLELPSNLILYRVGPRIWLSCQVVAWGLVATFQAFQHDAGSFYATRLLLGMMEAGFIPAGLYTLSLWYKRAETSKRFTIFYFGNLVAQGTTGMLAFGIFSGLSGARGLFGWQWMFIIEGLMTVFCGILLFIFLPNSPENPYPLTRINYFTARQREFMQRRVHLDDPSKIKNSHWVGWKVIWEAFTTWTVYPHLVISMCGIACVAAWGSYAPRLVQSAGYSGVDANAMVSIGYFLQIPVSFLLGYFADKTGKRGIALLIGMVGVWGFVIGNLIVHNSRDNQLKFTMLTMALLFSSTWQPINGSWLSINAKSPAQRSVFLAMFVSATNIGGIWGTQLFQPRDAPNYRVGWSAMVGVLSLAVAMILFLNGVYRWLNARNKRAVAEGGEVTSAGRVKYWL